MRGLVASGLLMLCTFTARAGDAPVPTIEADGSFTPPGANFRVTFQFSDLKAKVTAERTPPAPGLLSPVQAWSNEHGTFARLEICGVDHTIGIGKERLAAARLRITNPSDQFFHTTLAVVLVPAGAIHTLSFERHAFFMEGKPVLVADTPSRGAILAESPFAPRPLTPQDQAHVESAKGECRGEMIFDLALAPGQTQTLAFICPVRLPGGKEPDLDFYRGLSVDELFAQAQKDAAARWLLRSRLICAAA